MDNKTPHEHATPEAFWAGMQELRAAQQEIARLLEEQAKETDQRIKERARETDRIIKENARETDRIIKENARETGRLVKETSRLVKETSQQMKETDRRMKENARETDRRLDKSLNRMQGRFDNRWGDFMESLVEGDLVALLQRRDILVDRIHPRPYGKRNGEDFEFDIVAINGVEVVVVEVKTTLCAADIKHFLKKLLKYTYYEPEHRGKTIYGAMAYLKTSKAAKTHAERQGLFVIRATGDSASIVNEEGFVPRVFE